MTAVLSHRSNLRVSTGQIAREAEVDIALMHNEFGSKIGVFELMVRETLESVFARLRCVSLMLFRLITPPMLMCQFGFFSAHVDGSDGRSGG
ncbi:MAG: hypothetical protein ACRCWP_11485 [Shewanella sp.]